MMLTAVDAGSDTTLDLTRLSLSEVARFNGRRTARRHGIEILCRGCGWSAHVVVNHHGTRFFRHDPGHGNCLLSELVRRNGGESSAHIEGKARLAAAIRELRGWDVELERPEQAGGDAVVLDVAATFRDTVRHDGQGAFAWEVQLAPQTAGDFESRTSTIRRVAGRRTAWLTPHARHVGEELSMICDPEATRIVDRLLVNYEPRISSDPLPVTQIVKAIHRSKPKYRWFQLLDELGESRPFHVVHIDAWGQVASRPQAVRSSRSSGSAQRDEPCRRDPIESFAPLKIHYPNQTASSGLDAQRYGCAVCQGPVDEPWGFATDPPMCRDCFLDRQALKCNHCIGASPTAAP